MTDSPGDADPLFLSAREVYPLLPDFCLVSPGQDVQVLCQGARLQHLLVELVLVALPKGDVVSEMDFLLEHYWMDKSSMDIICVQGGAGGLSPAINSSHYTDILVLLGQMRMVLNQPGTWAKGGTSKSKSTQPM